MSIKNLITKRKTRLSSLALIFSLGLFGFGCSSNNAPAETLSDQTPADFVAESFKYAPDYDIPQTAKIFILPHHMVAAKQAAGMIKAMRAPKHIILLSPDHFSRSKTAFSTSGLNLTFDGQVFSNDPELNDLLSNVDGMSVDPTIVEKEHGITTLLPYLKTEFPDATIAPILATNDLTEITAKPLVDALTTALADPDTILIASIDMSHYLPLEIAEFHDVLTEDIIRSLDVDSINQMEIGAPGAMRITLETATKLGLGDVRIHDHTNSLIILKALVTDESTSHLFVSFSPGKPKPRAVETHLFCRSDIETREDRLYHGQTDILSPIKDGEDACIGLVIKDRIPNETFILPLEVTDSGWDFVSKLERQARLDEWSSTGKLRSLQEEAHQQFQN